VDAGGLLPSVASSSPTAPYTLCTLRHRRIYHGFPGPQLHGYCAAYSEGRTWDMPAVCGRLSAATCAIKRAAHGSSTWRELCWVVQYSSSRKTVVHHPKRPVCALSHTMDMQHETMDYPERSKVLTGLHCTFCRGPQERQGLPSDSLRHDKPKRHLFFVHDAPLYASGLACGSQLDASVVWIEGKSF
jgi:hypothetical protein